MNTTIANGPATRLLSRAWAPSLGGVAPRWGQHSSNYKSRHYASTSISPSSRQAKPSQSRSSRPGSPPAPPRTQRQTTPSRNELARMLFSSKDVPSLQEWMNNLESLENHDLTALQCLEAAQRYVNIATQHESQWRGTLEKQHKLTPYLLHWTGLALISANSAARWRLGTHMMRSASELGYMPSTLTLVRIFRSMPIHMFGKASSTIMYREANARFEKYLSVGADSNAFTLNGIICAKDGRNAQAMDSFRRATLAWQKTEFNEMDSGKQIASKRDEEEAAAASREFTLPPPREPRWDWEVSNVLGQANILIKDFRTVKQAEKMFRVAALELDSPQAFLMLAKLMGGPRDSPERRTYLLKAAISGEAEACRGIGELEQLAAASTTHEKERAEHEFLSKEWFRLAEGEDLSALTKSAETDDGNLD